MAVADIYRDPHLPAERRAESLLAHMTLEEKIGQMCQYVAEAVRSDTGNVDEAVADSPALEELAELVRQGRVGSFLKVPGADVAAYLQARAAESRLAIPLLIATDAIHGHGMDVPAATIFPSPIGLAASFDVELAERVAACTARELRATGFHCTFSPNVDVVRDPRWGRTGESFGEDPLLVGELGAALVRGYQGDFGPDSVLACAKHLVGGGAPENGLNGSPAELSERTLREVFLPPFQRAIATGVGALMPSHNEVGGMPCHADPHLLGELLRGQWGFDGFVISDWLDVERLHSVHRVAETPKEAVRLAVLAGVDVHMHGPGFFEALLQLVQEGAVPASRIDAAVRRILTAKFRLGLFETGGAPVKTPAPVLLQPSHLALALEASRKSLVLLTNPVGMLPFSPALRRVLVTGPNADDQSLLGDWARPQPHDRFVSILRGIERIAPAGVEVHHVPTGPIAGISDEQIAAAAAAARDADAVVLAIGESSARDDPARTSGENVDRCSLEPPGRQLELMRAVLDAGTPVVVVLVNGGPIASEWMVQHAAAIVEAWEPGLLGGLAIAELLFGHIEPSGRLPITIPRSVGHIRSYYDHRPSAHHRGRFRFASIAPLFEFGHGLGYTTFRYLALRAKARIAAGEALLVEVELENSGARAAEEIVRVFVEDVYASVTRPVKQLRAFRRVRLDPGATARLEFALGPGAFTLLDASLQPVIEPGEFRISLGGVELSHSVWVTANRAGGSDDGTDL